MNTKKVAIIVDPYSSGNYFAPAFKKFGVESAALLSSKQPLDIFKNSYNPTDFSKIIIVNENLEITANELKDLNPLCILAGSETGVELAETITPLVLPEFSNNPSLIKARRDKGEMYKAVAKAGIPTIPQICTNNIQEVTNWITTNNLQNTDLVIKPPKSGGTDSVIKAPNAKNWQTYFNSILGSKNQLGIVNDNVLVQKYAYGDEYVVDFFSYEGVHTVCDICKYSKVDNGNFMATYESMEWLPETTNIYNEIVDYAKSVLNALGVKFGTSHLELILTKKEPLLVEVGIRPHGGGHPRFCTLATGDNQVERAARYFTDNKSSITNSYHLQQHVKIVFLLCSKKSIAKNVENFKNNIKSLASFYDAIVNVKDNDILEPTKDLIGTLNLGFVALTNKENNTLLEDYKTVRNFEKDLYINL